MSAPVRAVSPRRRPGRLLPTPLGISLTVMLFPGLALASPILELVGGLGGGGFNARVVGAGPGATYFNPALLPDQKNSVDVFIFGIGNTLSIDVNDRPAQADISAAIYDAWLSDGAGGITALNDPPLATADLPPRQGNGGLTGFKTYHAFGAVKHILDDKLVFGFYAAVPAGQIQSHNVFYNDEREQFFSNSLHFELYDDRLALSTFAFAFGSNITDRLSIGLGFVGAIDTSANTPVYVPDGADLSSVYLGQQLSVNTKLAPHFGAALRLHKYARLTAAVHTSSQVTVVGSNDIRLPNGTINQQQFTFTHGYNPLTIGIGAAVDAFQCRDKRVSVVGSLRWRNWSSYINRQSEQPTDPWSDTVEISLGGRYRVAKTEVFTDMIYAPTPVPDQTGHDNYLDNTRIGITAGMNVGATLLDLKVRGGFFIQAHQLIERTVTKDPNAANPVIDEFPDNSVNPFVDPDVLLPEAQGLQTNNPGYPGFSHGGVIVAAGVNARLEF